jgi:hypothetical protein
MTRSAAERIADILLGQKTAPDELRSSCNNAPLYFGPRRHGTCDPELTRNAGRIGLGMVAGLRQNMHSP